MAMTLKYTYENVRAVSADKRNQHCEEDSGNQPSALERLRHSQDTRTQ